MAQTDPSFALYQATIGTRIAELEGRVEAYPETRHELTVRKTTSPLETGASVTDHSVRDPSRLTLVGVVSDLYIPQQDEVVTRPGRPTQAWEQVRRLMRDRVLLEVVTTWGVYQNMLITRARATESIATGRGMEFSMSLEEVLIVGRASRDLPNVDPNRAAADRGGGVDRGDVSSGFLTVPGQPRIGSVLEDLPEPDRVIIGDLFRAMRDDWDYGIPAPHDIDVMESPPVQDRIAAASFSEGLTPTGISALESFVGDESTPPLLRDPVRHILNRQTVIITSAIRTAINVALRAQVVPIEILARQALGTVLGGIAVRLEAWWQEVTEDWFFSLYRTDNTPIFEGSRIPVGQYVPATPVPGFRGALTVEPMGALQLEANPGREGWGSTHRLVYQRSV